MGGVEPGVVRQQAASWSPARWRVTEGVERINHRAAPPGCDLVVACLVKPLEPFGVRGDRPDLCVADDVLGWGGTDDLAEPAPVRRAPGGPTGVAHSLPQQNGVQANLGGLEEERRGIVRPKALAVLRLMTSSNVVAPRSLPLQSSQGTLLVVGQVIRLKNDPTITDFERNLEAFRQALRDLGWIEGQNLAVEYRTARPYRSLAP
jgi:hypothetical protein